MQQSPIECSRHQIRHFTSIISLSPHQHSGSHILVFPFHKLEVEAQKDWWISELQSQEEAARYWSYIWFLKCNRCWCFSNSLPLHLLSDFPYILAPVLQYCSWLQDSGLLFIWVPEPQTHPEWWVLPYHLCSHLLWLFPFEDPLSSWRMLVKWKLLYCLFFFSPSVNMIPVCLNQQTFTYSCLEIISIKKKFEHFNIFQNM